MITIKNFTAVALTAAAALALPLSAANASEPRTVSISYGDLNLSSKAGQAILDRRINAAVEAVCGRIENRPTFDSAVRQCQSETRLTAQQSRDIAVASYDNGQLASNDRREIRLVAR